MSQISVHGVGLSIGGEGQLDRDHLMRLRHLCDWLKTGQLFRTSGLSTHDGGLPHDLLAGAVYDSDLGPRLRPHRRGAGGAGAADAAAKTRTLIAFAETAMDEVTFLTEITLVPAVACCWM